MQLETQGHASLSRTSREEPVHSQQAHKPNALQRDMAWSTGHKTDAPKVLRKLTVYTPALLSNLIWIVVVVVIVVVIVLHEVYFVPEDASDTAKPFDELRALLRSVRHELERCSKVLVVVSKPFD